MCNAKETEETQANAGEARITKKNQNSEITLRTKIQNHIN